MISRFVRVTTTLTLILTLSVGVLTPARLWGQDPVIVPLVNCVATNVTNTHPNPVGTFAVQTNGTYTFTSNWSVTFDCDKGDKFAQCFVCTHVLVTDTGNSAQAGDVYVSTLPAAAGCNTPANVANLTTTVSGLIHNYIYQFDFYYAPFNPASTCKLQGYPGIDFTQNLTAQ